jgi:nucleotide-binding universal stress UspA family protein
LHVVKVLIATDGSKEATAALQTANRLLSPAGRQIDLLCVAPRVRCKDGRNKAAGNGYERRVLSQITHILERARAKLSRNDAPVNLVAEIGSPSASIVNRAEDYDLTVIGPKGRGATGSGGLGPVASRVVEHALAPVLVGRALRSEEGVRVLVAVDGSTASMHAIETLTELFDLTAAEICLMHVAETPWTELGLEEDWVTYSEEDKADSEAGAMEKELVREGESVVEQARNLLRAQRVSITTRVDEGDPANEILSEADRGQYDLLVTGATGARDLKHSMLGSVSSKLAWNAPCSVLIVREPEQ